MNITIFTHNEHIKEFEHLLDGYACDCTFYDNYDDFIYSFPDKVSDAVIIARRGADGMESARSARLLSPSVPLIWLSDDNGFGVESYRIGCSFFSAEPLSEGLLKRALSI